MWTQNGVNNKIWNICVNTESAGLKFCRVEVLCDSGYEVTIVTHSLADLYLPKMKNASFVAPESNGLSCACAV